MRFRRLLSVMAFAVLLSTGPASGQQSGNPLPSDPRDPLLNQGKKKEAIGDSVMVSTQLPIVTEGALKVLREGGNAVDAMITAVFLQHVNDYHQVSHFGAMSAIYYEAKTQKYYVLSAVSERPRAEPGGTGDPGKVAIGGVVRGLDALAKRFGTRPWASYLDPAIRSAEEGVLVTSFMYGINYSNWENDDLITTNKEAREFFMPEGYLVPAGERWKMPALANTLRRVAAEGADYLYTGAWAEKFVREANKRGGRVTMRDMAGYEPKWQEPTRFTYRGHEIIGSPEPDTGGLVVGYNLNILENFDLKALGPYWESAEALEIMTRAFSRVSDETRFAIQDPLSFQVPGNLWLSKEYGRLGAQFVRETMPRVNLSQGADSAVVASGPPSARAGSLPSHDAAPELGSNHNVIVDADGNWISLLHTMHGGTPGVFIDGVRATGSTARAMTTGPGRRLVLPITSILIARDGKPWLAMGTPGSPPQPVSQVLVNMLDYGMTPAEATDAPRFWAARGTERRLEIESRIAPSVREGMAARGIPIRDLGPYSWNTGSMQIVWRDASTGKLHGVTDPRRLGYAAGF